MTAEQLLRECRDRLMPYDSKLRERIDAYLSTPAPPPDIAPEAEIARLREALTEIQTHSVCCDARHIADAASDAARKETK